MKVEVCVLGSGSSGNATYIGTEKTKLLIDCGLPAREIMGRLDGLGVSCKELSGILITHADIDHFTSAGTIHARFGIPVYTDRKTDHAIRRRRGNGSFWRIEKTGQIPDRLGDFTITACPVPHGYAGENAGFPVGFILEHRHLRVAHFTDLGEIWPSLCSQLKGANCYIIEANYHEPTVDSKLRDHRFAMDWGYLEWVASPQGHLSNLQCADALAGIVDESTSDIFLAHMSENHHDPRKDNNDFHLAQELVSRKLKASDKYHARLHRTYRRGKTESRPSDVVCLEK